jgi:hypothetical protein
MTETFANVTFAICATLVMAYGLFWALVAFNAHRLANRSTQASLDAEDWKDSDIDLAGLRALVRVTSRRAALTVVPTVAAVSVAAFGNAVGAFGLLLCAVALDQSVRQRHFKNNAVI